MSAPTPEYPPSRDWQKMHAFGWPGGSVRAVMALLICGTLWCQLVLWPDRAVPEALRDLLFIILGHYFATRGRAPGGEESGPPPLYLPRGTIRLVMIGGFLTVAVLLYRQGRLLSLSKNPGSVTLLLVGGFLLGVVVQRVASWWRGGDRPVPRVLEDLRATVSFLAALALVALVWDEFVPYLPATVRALPRFGTAGPERILAAVVGFYFGSRS